MRKVWALLVILGMLLIGAPSAVVQAQPTDESVTKAVEYMRTQQAADGTFAGFGPSSTADAIFALVAAGQDPAAFSNGGASALEGLRKLLPDAAKEPGLAAQFALALMRVGLSPREGGVDLIAAIENGYNADTARYGKDVGAQAFSLLALHAAGQQSATKSEAVDALKKLQLPDGGFSFDGTAAAGSDTNSTALVIQTLMTIEGKSDVVSKAVAYLKSQQNSDGGFPFSQTSQFGNASDANSTAFTIQALLAAGEDLNDYAKDGKTPLDRLSAFQNPSGAFRYQDTPPDDNAGATYQAVPALLGKTLPINASAPNASQTAAATTTADGTTSGQTVAPQATVGAGEPSTLPVTGRAAFPQWLMLFAGLSLLLGGIGVARRRVV